MSNKEQSVKRGDTSLAVKAGFWYVVSSFLIKGISFLTTPIFSRLMSRADYGEFSNYASWQATLLIITSAELYNTLSRAYYDYTDDFDKYASSITIATGGVTLAVYLVFLLCGSWIYKIVSIPQQFVHILFITLMCNACKSIFTTRERTLYRYKTVAFISMVNLLVPTLVAISLVISVPEVNRLPARIYGFYLPSALIGFVCAVVILKKGRFHFSIEHCKYAFKLALPMIVHYFTAYLLTSSNTIVTKSLLGASVSAVVSIASSTIHIFTVLFQSLSGAVTTWIMDNLSQQNHAKLRKDSMMYVGLLALVSAGVILIAPEVVWVLGGSGYGQSAALVPGMIVAVLIQSITSVFTIILTYDKNIMKTAIFTGIVAVLSVMTKIMILPGLGVNALPYVNIVAFGSLFVINYMLIKKAGYADAVNFKGMIIVISAVFALMLFSGWLYANTLIRYGIIVVFGVASCAILWTKRAIVLSFFKKRKIKK
ncbi:MAG: hypothetical protein E7218_07305 [Anaerofustis stercorihominis]|nr:hypothetical protein [Anaerofustis stercorihominis]